MYLEFDNSGNLIEAMLADRTVTGSASYVANRYPVRFVLFNNFRDANDFVRRVCLEGCRLKPVNDWMEEDCNDLLITYSNLTTQIQAFAKDNWKTDWVITPFSELARFYDNTKRANFDALISDIKAIEAIEEGYQRNQRIYIPIVGLEGKMSKYQKDSQITIWYFKNRDRQLNYNLIMTNGTDYGVKGLNESYTVVHNVGEWLDFWKDQSSSPRIISTSRTLFNNAKFAQPDNAFTFCECSNVFEFLWKGLNLNFGSIEYRDSDEEHWLRLASEINVDNFSFDRFFNNYFSINDLSSYCVFLKAWFDYSDSFHRWLLSNYYTSRFCSKGYICKALSATRSYADRDFFESIALVIFDEADSESLREERMECMQYAASKGVVLTEFAQEALGKALENLAKDKGYKEATRYLTSLTDIEKSIVVRWFGKNHIEVKQIEPIYPELFHYLEDGNVPLLPSWAKEYFSLYKKSKVSNCYYSAIENALDAVNGSSSSFEKWYNATNLKTTSTVLYNRSDISVYYWIDGLGVDWIPLVKYLVEQSQGIYLNEVYVARSKYPTTTSNNKPELVELAHNDLKKIGDLDHYNHQKGKLYPDSILEEINIVKKAIRQIISEYGGKKIAIVSDHGVSALSSMKEGLNLSGVESDHSGRIAIKKSGKPVLDSKYVICDDGKTLCSLTHQSLCNKTAEGESAHGGCTPEEVFVPVFVISNQKSASNYDVRLVERKLTASSPVLRYMIQGLRGVESIYLTYEGVRYSLSQENGNNYYSEPLKLKAGDAEVVLHIDDYQKTDTINGNLGAVEEDPFANLF